MSLDTLAQEVVATVEGEAVTTAEEEVAMEEEVTVGMEEEEVVAEKEVMVGTVEEGKYAKFGGGSPAMVGIQSSPQALSTGCLHPGCRGSDCFARPRACGQSARGPSYHAPPCATEGAASIPVTLEKALNITTWVLKGADSARSTAPVPFLC